MFLSSPLGQKVKGTKTLTDYVLFVDVGSMNFVRHCADDSLGELRLVLDAVQELDDCIVHMNL